MQQKVLFGLFTILLIALGVVLANLLSGEEMNVQVTQEYLSPSQKKPTQEISVQKSWTNQLAKSNSVDFRFPVNELFMQIDLKTYVPPKVKSFRLVIDKTDRYSMFCILQTLSSFNLPFVLEKESKTPNVFVTTKKKEELSEVTKKLKEYDIDSKIVEVWL